VRELAAADAQVAQLARVHGLQLAAVLAQPALSANPLGEGAEQARSRGQTK